MTDEVSPRRKAVALGYEAGTDSAPRIVAKGSGLLADRIVELAQEHGVPVHGDPDLMTLLSQVDVGTEIPESLYRAVAEVLAFLYRVNQGLKERV